eukprot:CAMPEP_0114433732 /NCGR_PEP_ID=MMETSP0103-20121206/11856_1 /TAXON_ID=37642 ORGANISM="Paraphysomonas imperforata, Strain PA2" /NCGR_SAMPLE_ID=MMETSP0103 /ASSEMBLY_ACC=CAM_ASM_000201 /LENGTH=164 /DNA_ID=CAMNT_0001603515 /DNA_START=24 /DNA_END=518 /DNA_ORIENTATION=+
MADFMDMPEPEGEEEQQQEQQQQQQEEFVQVESPVLPEPERDDDALAKFNLEWNIQLAAKKEAEDALNAKSEEEAKVDIENFNAQREIRLNAKKEVNRSEEQVYLEQQESELEGNTWDRVTKLVDSSVEEGESDKSDVSRMRKLFIQLKNEPLESTRSAPVESN